MIADKRIIKVMIDAWTDSCPALVLQCLGAVSAVCLNNIDGDKCGYTTHIVHYTYADWRLR